MFLTGKAVAIVTSDVMKMTTTCLAMIGNLFDIIIVVTLVRYFVAFCYLSCWVACKPNGLSGRVFRARGNSRHAL